MNTYEAGVDIRVGESCHLVAADDGETRIYHLQARLRHEPVGNAARPIQARELVLVHPTQSTPDIRCIQSVILPNTITSFALMDGIFHCLACQQSAELSSASAPGTEVQKLVGEHEGCWQPDDEEHGSEP